MNGFGKIFLSVYTMFVCYLMINLFFGTGGILQYNKLTEYKNELSSNIEELDGINKDLYIESEKLIHNSDDIKIKARELGWFDHNEGIIVVKGFNKAKPGYSMGKLLSREKFENNDKTLFRLIAILAGVSFYVAAVFSSKSRKSFSKTSILD